MLSLQYRGLSVSDLMVGCNIAGQSSITTGSMSQKTHFQRSAKGPLAISQVEPNGAWVEVENTGRKEENLSGWRISRKADNKIMPYYEFPDGIVLGNSRDSRSVKIYAAGQGPAGALVYSLDNWGTGSQVTTSLVSPSGEVRQPIYLLGTKQTVLCKTASDF